MTQSIQILLNKTGKISQNKHVTFAEFQSLPCVDFTFFRHSWSGAGLNTAVYLPLLLQYQASSSRTNALSVCQNLLKSCLFFNSWLIVYRLAFKKEFSFLKKRKQIRKVMMIFCYFQRWERWFFKVLLSPHFRCYQFENTSQYRFLGQLPQPLLGVQLVPWLAGEPLRKAQHLHSVKLPCTERLNHDTIVGIFLTCAFFALLFYFEDILSLFLFLLWIVRL